MRAKTMTRIKGSVQYLTEDLLNAEDNLKKAKSLLEEAENALTKEYISMQSNPYAMQSQTDKMLVKTDKGWILLKFNSDAFRFTGFENFGDYGIVIP